MTSTCQAIDTTTTINPVKAVYILTLFNILIIDKWIPHSTQPHFDGLCQRAARTELWFAQLQMVLPPRPLGADARRQGA